MDSKNFKDAINELNENIKLLKNSKDFELINKIKLNMEDLYKKNQKLNDKKNEAQKKIIDFKKDKIKIKNDIESIENKYKEALDLLKDSLENHSEQFL